MGRRAGVLVLIGVLAALSGASGRRLERMTEGRSAESSLLYLPNGRYLKIASLGQSSLVADAIYLWAIQYYSDYERSDRFRFVEHVFGNVITELDPHYKDPYWLGAMILSIEAHDLDAALRLLDKGLANNPEQWIFPYLAGWECYEAGDLERAAEYFQRSADVPGAPMLPRRMVAGMIARAGDTATALALWTEVRDDPASDPSTVRIAERQVRTLSDQLTKERLEAAIRRFRTETGRMPRSLDVLRARGYIAEVPLDPDGRPYAYDPVTGHVAAASGRVLGANR